MVLLPIHMNKKSLHSCQIKTLYFLPESRAASVLLTKSKVDNRKCVTHHHAEVQWWAAAEADELSTACGVVLHGQ